MSERKHASAPAHPAHAFVLKDAITKRQVYPELTREERPLPTLPELVGEKLKEREELVQFILEAGNIAREALAESGDHPGSVIRPNASTRRPLVDLKQLRENVRVRENMVDELVGFYDWALQSPELQAAGLAPTKVLDKGRNAPNQGTDGLLHDMHTRYIGLGPDHAVVLGLTVYRDESPNSDYAKLPLSTTPRTVLPTEVGVIVHYPGASLLQERTQHKAVA